MPRLDTRVESAGAEFLSLGKLLIEKIQSYKSYGNFPNYDIVSTNPRKGLSCRIQVKSRFKEKAGGFLINKFDCDFVIFVCLNRSRSKAKGKPIVEPDYYVFPIRLIKRVVSQEVKWQKVLLRRIKKLTFYKDAWHLIKSQLQLN